MSGTLLAAAWDDAVVTIVRVYEDSSHQVGLNATPPCTTVHALATGLGPLESGLRFVWRDDTGAAVQLTSTTTDSQGRCQSSRSLGPGGGGQ